MPSKARHTARSSPISSTAAASVSLVVEQRRLHRDQRPFAQLQPPPLLEVEDRILVAGSTAEAGRRVAERRVVREPDRRPAPPRRRDGQRRKCWRPPRGSTPVASTRPARPRAGGRPGRGRFGSSGETRSRGRGHRRPDEPAQPVVERIARVVRRIRPAAHDVERAAQSARLALVHQELERVARVGLAAAASTASARTRSPASDRFRAGRPSRLPQRLERAAARVPRPVDVVGRPDRERPRSRSSSGHRRRSAHQRSSTYSSTSGRCEEPHRTASAAAAGNRPCASRSPSTTSSSRVSIANTPPNRSIPSSTGSCSTHDGARRRADGGSGSPSRGVREAERSLVPRGAARSAAGRRARRRGRRRRRAVVRRRRSARR